MAAVALAPRLGTSLQARKLRVGLVADARTQPRWVIEAFDRVARSDFAEIVVISARNARASQPPWLWQLYARVDRALLGLHTLNRTGDLTVVDAFTRRPRI